MKKERRSLVEGLESTPDVVEAEKEFVFGNEKPVGDTRKQKQQSLPSDESEAVLPQYLGRVPFTTRCKPVLASKVKRASLQRQLDGVEPNNIQEILEEAIEAWLRKNGYL
ncbi:MAG: hypothetical protein MPJ50_15385 [Pirellulales bacterium]|nr:hypothetical protein [Pirellulales bacterium]